MNAIQAMKKNPFVFLFLFVGLPFAATNAMAALSVSITAPAANASFGSGATITITGSASPTTGKTVTKVEFFYGATNLIATDTANPYSVTWIPPAPGTYSLTAKVTDSGNNTKTSTAVSIKVLAPPTVSVTSPANGATFLPGATVSIAATATAASGASISKVQFFNGATLLGQDTTSPYTFSWTNVPSGNYAITAKANDSKSGATTSAPVNITVSVPHAPPDVSITAPASGAVTQGPANFTITAVAIPHDSAAITRVDFYNGATLLGSATSPPYAYNWANVGSGGYLLSAVATDSTGASSTSPLVYAIVDGADTCDATPPVTARDTGTKLAQSDAVPLEFEENVGQVDSRVRFLARGKGYQLFLTASGSTVALRSAQGDSGAAVSMRFAGAHGSAPMSGLDKSRAITNYLIGRDPSRWRTHVANYGRVLHRSVYPGIDAVYHASRGALEYDLQVAPGADPNRIRLAFDGAQNISIDESGDLRLLTAAGTISQKRPFAYQEIAGERRGVRAEYRVVAKNMVAFELGHYDHERPLVIDPVLVYSTYLGGSDSSTGADAIALSRCGEAFVSGWTWATDYPATAGAFDPVGEPNSQKGFVTKLSQDGSGVIFSTYISGTEFDTDRYIAQSTELVSIALDGTGHAYVSGTTNSWDFPVTPNAIFAEQPSDPAGIVAKLTTDGSALAFATYMDGGNVPSIAVDGSGSAYIGNAHRVRKMSVDGSSFAYSFVVDSGGGNDTVTAVAVDGDGNAYATGSTFSSFLPVTAGAFEATRPNSTSFASGYVAKVNPQGTGVVFATYFGNTGTVRPSAIALDASGNVYLAGQADGKPFPLVIPASRMFNMDLDQAGNMYAFAARLSADGSHADWFDWVGGMLCPAGSQFCSAAQTRANALAVDSSANVWIAGSTGSNRIPLTKPLNANFSPNGGDAFAIKLASTGTSMVFGMVLNGTTVGTPAGKGFADPSAMGVKVDSVGSAYVVGRTNKVDFPTTPGAYQTAPRSNLVANAFVTKINETKDTATVLAVTPGSASIGNPVTVTATISGNAPSGTVTFADGGSEMGTAEVSGATAELVTSALGGGLHSLTASYAGDANNNPSVSSAVFLNVSNPAGQPSISMTGIADGANLLANSGNQYAGGRVTVNANAAAGNAITSVTIYFGSSTFFWTLNTPSFTGIWALPNLNPGFYTFYADAVDNFGNRTTTPTVHFVVNTATAAAPSVAIASPLNGASFVSSDTIGFNATATAQGSATISNVTYYQGLNVIGSAFAAPYAVNWSGVAPGTYSVIAFAQDSTGARMLSAPITITVTSPPPPTVSITSPADGSSFTTPVSIPITASATPASGATITKVDFYDGASLLGTVASPPYTFTWSNATGGTHSLTAKATDNRNATATSSPITINVTTPPPPSVGIASPANGSSFAPPASIAVTVNATPIAGSTITNVELYANGVLVANGANLLWNVAVAGTYSLTARAYDDHGGVGTSAPVSVSIVGDPNEKVTFIHNDFAGNPIAATDLTGAVVWKESYTPFGQRLVNATGSSSNRQWFGGKPSDSETGLSYFGARYYDPTVGRFMGIDSVGFQPSNVHSFGRFGFANENPYRFTDPDGRFAVAAEVIILATALVIATESPEHIKRQAESVGRLVGAIQSAISDSNPDDDAKRTSDSAPAGASSGGAMPPDDEDGPHTKVTDSTKGRSVKNTDISVTRPEFEKNLEESGYARSVSKDGKVANFEKGEMKFSVRSTSNSRGPSVDVYRQGELVEKLRLKE